jgi:hypothetical protein
MDTTKLQQNMIAGICRGREIKGVRKKMESISISQYLSVPRSKGSIFSKKKNAKE